MELDGTGCMGSSVTSTSAARSSPASLTADRVTVYSPGFIVREAASSI